jgi:hypothetical protein
MAYWAMASVAQQAKKAAKTTAAINFLTMIPGFGIIRTEN